MYINKRKNVYIYTERELLRPAYEEETAPETYLGTNRLDRHWSIRSHTQMNKICT